MISTLVVLGAGGDLAGRLLLPALASLVESGQVGREFRLIAADAHDWSEGEFADHVDRRLSVHAPHVARSARDALVASLRYRRADVTVTADVARVLAPARAVAGRGAPLAVYLALPTRLMLPAVRGVTADVLPAGSRIAIEKPFGQDAASAAELDAALAAAADAAPIEAYRIDHALAMDAIRRLPEACYPGTGERIDWSNRHIAQLDLLWEETLALEGRASFYDRAGALRDVMQNHLVQVLCTIAAADARPRRSAGSGPTSPADRRAQVLRTVRPLDHDAVVTGTRRARYVAGRLAGEDAASGRTVPDYAAEDGVDASRNTETFAEVLLHLDSPRWSGTRFVLRAGKALDARRRGVRIHPRPGAGADRPVWLDFDGPDGGGAEPLAYRRILADLLGGGTEYAVGGAEAELAWTVFMPVLRAWHAGLVPLETYRAGSTGP